MMRHSLFIISMGNSSPVRNAATSRTALAALSATSCLSGVALRRLWEGARAASSGSSGDRPVGNSMVQGACALRSQAAQIT